MTSERSLIFCGDIHGELKKLVWELVIRRNITNADVVVLGDFGIGFIKKTGFDILYKKIEKRLEKNNITIYAIRGNHDDPSYFDGKHDYPRVKFLQDYKVINLCGKEILPIGGATSIDSEWRRKYNSRMEHLGSDRRIWWEGENIVRLKDFKQLPSKVDIIISHDSPRCFNPVTVRTSNIPYSDWKRATEDRIYLESILDKVVTSYWFHGHYHESSSGTFGNILYRGLSINELFQLIN